MVLFGRVLDLLRILGHSVSFIQHTIVFRYIKSKPISRSTVVDKVIGDQQLNFMLLNLAMIVPIALGQFTDISEGKMVILILFARVNMLMYIANFLCIAGVRYCYIFHWAWISEVPDARLLICLRSFSFVTSVIGSLLEVFLDTSLVYRTQYQVFQQTCNASSNSYLNADLLFQYIFTSFANRKDIASETVTGTSRGRRAVAMIFSPIIVLAILTLLSIKIRIIWRARFSRDQNSTSGSNKPITKNVISLNNTLAFLLSILLALGISVAMGKQGNSWMIFVFHSVVSMNVYPLTIILANDNLRQCLYKIVQMLPCVTRRQAL